MTESTVNETDRLVTAARQRTEHGFARIDWQNLRGPNDLTGTELDYHPLSSSEWFQDQSRSTRQAVTAAMIAWFARTGMEFERILNQGLLSRMRMLQPSDSEYEFTLIEVIEECQHIEMFRELAHRCDKEVASSHVSVTPHVEEFVVRMGSDHPALFFASVLAGEQPIDTIQRAALKIKGMNTVVRDVCRWHIRDEARHISYAYDALRSAARGCNRPEQRRNQLISAGLVAGMVRLMTDVPSPVTNRFGVPQNSESDQAQASFRLRSCERLLQVLKGEGMIPVVLCPMWRSFGLDVAGLDD